MQIGCNDARPKIFFLKFAKKYKEFEEKNPDIGNFKTIELHHIVYNLIPLNLFVLHLEGFIRFEKNFFPQFIKVLAKTKSLGRNS